MLGWILAVALALLAFAACAWALRSARATWSMIAAALLFGLAGYAMQAHPGLAGAPKAAVQQVSGDPAALISARQTLNGQKGGLPGNKWLLIGDALARQGNFADAAGVMLGAVEAEPGNSDAWLAIANVLVAHADSTITPASLLAYQNAAKAAPDHPGPPFFLGLALAQSGRLAEARGVWAELLAKAPADAPWRGDLAARLKQLDEFIASQPGER